MDKELKEIFKAYDFNEKQYIGQRPVSVGHINTTYILYFDLGNRVKRYLLQEINVNVFKNPEELMDNIVNVTKYGKNILKGFNVPNYKNKIIRVYQTVDDKSYIKTSTGKYYRVYHYTEGGISFDVSNDETIFKNAGSVIGFFQNLLANYPIDKLHDTIPDFHNTPKRYEAFTNILEKASDEIKATCADEISFYNEHKDIAYSVYPLIEKGEMPLRVTHNDTKLNNIMFDADTNEGLCLLDLDTVMSGSVIYDFGDFVRSGCNMGEEDSKDLRNVVFNKDLFLAFASGYIKSVSGSITEIEVKNLTQGAILMTYECGMRFLTDYLDGNKYFRVEYPEHNLVRSRTQISMVKQMLKVKNELDKKIMTIYENETK